MFKQCIESNEVQTLVNNTEVVPFTPEKIRYSDTGIAFDINGKPTGPARPRRAAGAVGSAGYCPGAGHANWATTAK